ncbi:LysR family transcriptional regulator [Paenibacillus lutrae]|uniref:LysR family transcriptional regulator n=1 Tax=Paenibacillus lutrae TaxID=2078573 RepID=A0A7X3FK17_9BACL|nr:LysR family transcriptional regulator [Paenibacillus lutrae]MVP01171.1 LysR family transcriptional regulator [Paenibacillus lutrae]
MFENLEGYRVFYYTARAGSFTRAAEHLCITQPAVTHSIKQLESRLGVQLFFRTSKGAVLTHEGNVLLQHVGKAFNFIESGERKLADMRQLMEGEIRIGAGDTLSKHYLLPHLKQFHDKYPAIKIQVTNRTTPETLLLLKEGRIDLGLVNLPLQDKHIHVQETLLIQDCLVAGPQFKELTEGRYTWEQLSRYPILLLEKGSHTRASFDSYTRQLGLDIQPEIELGSLDLLLEFASMGFGLACVVREFAEDDLARMGLCEVRLEQPLPPRKAGIITLKDVPLNTAAKRFVELLTK